MCWTTSRSSPARSTSWTAPTWISKDCTPSIAPGAFFVTRTKAGVILNRRYSHPVSEGTGLRSDQTVVLGTDGSAKRYPDTLRRVRFIDPIKGTPLIFLTNNFDLPALTITQLYKSRWQVELFFKWIKQHLRIKAFYGHSEN